MLTGNKKSIKELLESGKYSLVNNQREYVWSLGGGQISDFLTDIKYYSERPNNKWFLGQVVLLRKMDNGAEEFKIIDGQQRLTTICLFLAACRDKAKNLGNSPQVEAMQRYISFVNGTDGSFEGLRVSASKSIRDIFNQICSKLNFDYGKPDSVPDKQWRKQLKVIKNVFEEFNKFVADKDQKSLNMTITALLEAYVFMLLSEDAMEAYSLFENTNAKGTPLEATDLLKNLLMGELGDTEAMESDWNEIANNSGATGIRMLRYFYTSKCGTLERGNVYKKVRDKLVKGKAKAFVNEYRAFSLFYRTLMDDISEQSLQEMLNEVFNCREIQEHEQSFKRIFHAIQGIQLLDVILCYPMLYSLINAHLRNEKTDGTRKAIVRMFEAIEKFHFVNTRICDLKTNRVETLYASYSDEFNKCDNDMPDLVNNLIEKMRKEYTAEQDIFIANFKDLEYNEANLSRNAILYYIFDRFNRFDEEKGRLIDPAAWMNFYSPQKAKRHLNSIEHLSPRTPNSGKAMENVHNIGNLFIIGTELNGRLGNLSPNQKISRLRNELYQDIGNNKILKEIVGKYDDEWDEERVNARAIDLANRAYNKIWKL